MHAAIGNSAAAIPKEVMAEREFNRTGSSSPKASPRKAAKPLRSGPGPDPVTRSDSLTSASFRKAMRAASETNGHAATNGHANGHPNGSCDAHDVEMGALPREVGLLMGLLLSLAWSLLPSPGFTVVGGHFLQRQCKWLREWL